ncbi:MAG: ABC transporter permease [Acidobacteriota bacterium]
MSGPLPARLGRWLTGLLLIVAWMAPLLANDRPLILAAKEVTFPALGQLPLAGPWLERAGWEHRDWRQAVAGERWRLPAPIPYSYRQTDLEASLSPPSRRHLLGTDRLGRDLASRILAGCAVSLQVGLISTAVALALGILLGALAGFLGGAVDFVVSRTVEVALCFPTFFLILTVLAFRSPSLLLLFAVIGLSRWPSLARYVRAEVIRVREGAFVEAARATGAGAWRVLLRHVLPHALAPALVAATFQLAGAMLVEAGLSFLGFGVPEPLPSWGGLLRDAQGTGSWWLVLFPGLTLTLAVTGVQLVGERFRDALDPRIARL